MTLPEAVEIMGREPDETIHKHMLRVSPAWNSQSGRRTVQIDENSLDIWVEERGEEARCVSFPLTINTLTAARMLLESFEL